MQIGIARTVFALQGLFLMSSGSVMLLSPSTVSAPGAQLHGVPKDVTMVFGLSSISLGMCFTLAATRGPRDLFQQMLILFGAGKALAVGVQMYCGPKWYGVAIWEAVTGAANLACACLI
ncbi:hypothetical protein NQ176_g4263 [Zarea fungicola]|uniref:Uncharacterized protein n=1 Tax=Zarea fungicola TaxID=93591 RepID=A0ACC1NE78_9HYPO|nr:hypothetical protein NQ176_g4263 [Lecanicillium fungicola]